MGDFVFTDPALACDLGFQLAYKCAGKLAKNDSKQIGLLLPAESKDRESSSLVTKMLSAAEEQFGKAGAVRLTEEIMIFSLDRSGFHPEFTHGPIIVPFVSMAEAGQVRANPRATAVIWVPATTSDVDMSLVQEWNGLMVKSVRNDLASYVTYTPKQQQDLGYV